MKKMVFGKKLSRDSTSRRALYRALVRSFVMNKKLVTTYSKARVIIPIIEKLIVKAKRDSISDRRFVYAFTGNDRAVAGKILELAKVVVPEKGGFLKFTNLPARKGDNAPVARVEFAQKIEDKAVKKEDSTGGESLLSGKKKTLKETKHIEKKPKASSIIKKLAMRKKTEKTAK